MIPPTHFLASWVVANTAPLNRRERAVVTIAGVIPDLDGLGFPVEYFTSSWDRPLEWYFDYHHILGHNIGFAAVVAVGSYILTKGNWLATLLAIFTFHLHLLCDVIGSRGVDDYQWPIPYLLPFSNAWQWTWSGQWTLGSWQNRVIGVVLLAISLWLARRRGFSFLEIFSTKADAALVSMLRRWWPTRPEWAARQ